MVLSGVFVSKTVGAILCGYMRLTESVCVCVFVCCL